MKAPDKLYIGRRNYGPLIGGWESRPFASKEIESIEYIRKDALLEWAKETYLSENASAIRKVCFKQLVEKLNEM